jgi:hypothetical protein
MLLCHIFRKCRQWSTEGVPFNWADDCICSSNGDEHLPLAIEDCIIKPPVPITRNPNFQQSEIRDWLEVELVGSGPGTKLGLICKFAITGLEKC